MAPDISESRYDLSTLSGRLLHFFCVMNPIHNLNMTFSGVSIDAAAEMVAAHKAGKSPPNVTEEELWRAKYLLESSHHPDTGDRIPLPGRICFQAPGSATIGGFMLTLHSSTSATLFLQWVNQSFMAMCNWCNRNAKGEEDEVNILGPYLAATGGSLTTAYGLKQIIARAPPAFRGASIAVPMVSCAVASIINVPFMRMRELQHGIVVEDDCGSAFETRSRAAALYSVAAVTACRIFNASADLVLTPAIVGFAATRGYWWAQAGCGPAIKIPLYTCMCFTTLCLSTPITTAIVPQRASLAADRLGVDLQHELRERTRAKGVAPVVFFNKGL
jgi:tricarboxylate carrier